MSTSISRISVSILVLGAIVRAGTAQQQRSSPQPNPWLDRSVALTTDLGYDALHLERYDRSVMWARVGGAWWKIDRERARGYFLKAVEILELAQGDEQKDISCRSAAARTVLAIVASRDRELHSRLISLIGITNDRANSEQKAENAAALADVGLSLVSDDPQGAARFGEASLHLGFSPRLARLLWSLRVRDPDSADRLLREIAQAGRIDRDFNWFSLLTTAAFKGPFTSEQERTLVLRALADSVAHDNPAENGSGCHLTSFIPPLLSYYEKLLPQEMDRLQIVLTQCGNRLSNDSAGSRESSEPQATPDTVDTLLAAAGKSRRGEDRDDYLLKAASLAADQKNLDRAIRILDSIDSDGRERLKNAWSDLRWNYGSTVACSFAAKNDYVRMTEIIDQTPRSVRAFVAIFLVGTCKSLVEPAQKLQLLASARILLNKSTTSQEAEWYIGLVRRYAEIQPDETTAVLSDAIAAINRAAEDETKTCSPDRRVSPVLTTDLIFDRYKIPVSLLGADEIAVRSAVSAVRASNKRAAMRLLLLNATLAQSVKEQQKAAASNPK